MLIVDKRKLIDIIDRFPGLRIVVWGDFILDEHLYGTTRRISREAPVLILSYRNQEYFLGGAGNALQNIKSLGAEPVPVGVIGADESGKKILAILKSMKIPAYGLLSEKDFRTPLKTRILAGEDNTRQQQILRIDREGCVPDDTDMKNRIGAALARALSVSSALLVSDYNYHTVREDLYKALLPGLRKKGFPVAVDSRFRLLSFKGATVATPNLPEIEAALKTDLSGRPERLKTAGLSLLRKLASPALLVTRGSQGMALFEKGRPPFMIPVSGTTDIVDVTGAGDTVISVFTLALASDATFREAALLANFAGGIVVMKKGAASLTAGELKQAISS